MTSKINRGHDYVVRDTCSSDIRTLFLYWGGSVILFWLIHYSFPLIRSQFSFQRQKKQPKHFKEDGHCQIVMPTKFDIDL